MNPRVKTVVAQDAYKLEITFTNGEVGVFDCAPLITFGVFKEFADIRYFKQARVLHGTVAWPNEQDICPDTLYEDSEKIARASAEPDDARKAALRTPSSGSPAAQPR